MNKTSNFENVLLEKILEKNIQVMHVCAGNRFGGIEKMVLAFAQNPNGDNQLIHNFSVCHPGRLLKEIEKCSVNSLLFGPARQINPFGIYFAKKKLAAFVKKLEPVVALCHGDWIFDLFGRTLARAGAKVIRVLHNIHAKKNWIFGKNSNPSYCFGVIANSLVTRENYLANNTLADVQVANPPFYLRNINNRQEERERLRQSLGIGLQTKVILTAARFEHGKGLDILINALSIVDQGADWVCLFAGSPNGGQEEKYLSKLKALAYQKLQKGKLIWLGHIDDLSGYYVSADLYCQPNRKPESYGLTFAEASEMGCPVVTAAIGGACEVLAGNPGNTLLQDISKQNLANEIARRFSFSLNKGK